MAGRLERSARRLGIDATGRDRLQRCFATAMEPRRERLSDEHHPDYLHPARTALILMDDAGVTEAAVLCLGLLAETRDPSLTPGPRALEGISRGLRDQVARLCEITRPGDQSPLERLLTLPPGLARVAVAERLDHARHLHLRDRSEWEEYHTLTCEAFAPTAGRLNETLGRRLRAWCDTFRRRFLV